MLLSFIVNLNFIGENKSYHFMFPLLTNSHLFRLALYLIQSLDTLNLVYILRFHSISPFDFIPLSFILVFFTKLILTSHGLR